jgi:hypothetical protein
MFTEPGSAREEAERLIAAALAAATLAANANPHWSTGSAECCVCPLCKVIAAVRDPDPQFVERLATGAGDLAAGLTSFLRNIAPPERTEDPWQQATREPAPDDPAAAPAQPPAKPMAKKVAKKAVKKVVKKAARPSAGQRPVNTVFPEQPSGSDIDL